MQHEKISLCIGTFFHSFSFRSVWRVQISTAVSPNKIPRHHYYLTYTFNQYTQEFHNDYFFFQKITMVIPQKDWYKWKNPGDFQPTTSQLMSLTTCLKWTDFSWHFPAQTSSSLHWLLISGVSLTLILLAPTSPASSTYHPPCFLL